MSAFRKNLSPTHFREVLNSILNPNLPLGEAVYDPEEQVEEVKVEEDSKEILDAEKEAVQAADSNQFLRTVQFWCMTMTECEWNEKVRK